MGTLMLTPCTLLGFIVLGSVWEYRKESFSVYRQKIISTMFGYFLPILRRCHTSMLFKFPSTLTSKVFSFKIIIAKHIVKQMC